MYSTTRDSLSPEKDLITREIDRPSRLGGATERERFRKERSPQRVAPGNNPNKHASFGRVFHIHHTTHSSSSSSLHTAFRWPDILHCAALHSLQACKCRDSSTARQRLYRILTFCNQPFDRLLASLSFPNGIPLLLFFGSSTSTQTTQAPPAHPRRRSFARIPASHCLQWPALPAQWIQ